jgi:excisionase family DNA binding protein
MSTIRVPRPTEAEQRHAETPGTQPGFESGPSLSLPLAASPPNDASHGIERLLTSKEASEVLKIHPKVLERMAKRGEVPALKVGKFWRYRASTLDAWINSRLQSGRQPCRMETSF